jgi:poly-gamma-glutamate capsule biosynthesis protein CapA/YwtB (metallophosphatase superfamily)
MKLNIILTGDINLRGVTDPAIPFSLLAPQFRAADLVFGNLECCLYDAPGGGPRSNPAFFAPSHAGGEALQLGGFHAVGLANNVNFGDAPVKASIARLDELGIAHTGAGTDLAAACAPVILERHGARVGILQRTSVYWAANHEAKEDAPGVAVIRGHTAYHLPLHRDTQPMNRPGIPPVIMTWADPEYLVRFRDDLASLRKNADVVIASFHWGTGAEVHQYMSEIAHAAIDGGADVVVGHGPHDHLLPIEVYKGKPIYYGLGALSFQIGHVGHVHNWVGIVADIGFEDGALGSASFRFVRQDSSMLITPSRLADEQRSIETIRERSTRYGTQLTLREDRISIALP